MLMRTNNWKQKLLDAADRSGRSDREISMAVGVNPSYLNEMRRLGKEPSVPRALALAQELKISLASLFMGREDISAADEELLALSHQATEDERATILALWRRLHPERPEQD